MIASRVVLALLDALWQGAIVALAAALLLRVVRTNAATRYAVWLAVLAILTVLPAIDFATAAEPALPSERHTRTVIPDAPERMLLPKAAARPAHVLRTAGAAMPARFDTPVSAVVVVDGAALAWPLALAIVALIAAVRLAALGRGYLHVRAVARGGRTLDYPLPIALARPVRLAVSDALAVPVAIGLGAPAIVLPAALVAALPAEELNQVLLHEAAHVARRDDYTNLVQRIVTAVLFFHPAVYAVARRLDIEREIACDDWVVASSGGHRTYATCLTKLAELATGRLPARLPAAGLFATRSALRRRVEHLLDARADGRPRRTRFATVATVALGVLALGIGAVRLPVIATTLEEKPSHGPVAATAASGPAARAPRAGGSALVRHVREVVVIQSSSRISGTAVAPRPPAIAPPPLPGRAVAIIAVPSAALLAPRADLRGVPAAGGSLRAPAAAAIRMADLAQELALPVPPPAAGSAGAPPPADSTSCASGCVFRGVDLHGRDLHGRNFIGAQFIDVNLDGADLRGAHLAGAVFVNVNLTGAHLNGAFLTGATFRKCACDGADFAAANLTGATFMNAGLQGAVLRTSRITGATFRESNLSGVVFANARLVGVTFSNTKLDGADFQQASLTATSFLGSDTSKADFRGAHGLEPFGEGGPPATP